MTDMPEKPEKWPGASSEYLLQAVLAVLTEETSEIRLQNKKRESVPLSIVRTYIDPTNYDDHMPAVFVRFTGWTQERLDDGAEQRIGNVEITLGVFLEEYSADEWASSLMDRIGHRLLSNRIVDGKYRLVLPLTWTVNDNEDQPYPYWFATMPAAWYMPAIGEETPEL